MGTAQQNPKSNSETHGQPKNWGEFEETNAPIWPPLTPNPSAGSKQSSEASKSLPERRLAVTTEAPSASHCFDFESDFIGNWRCIPLCVRRKLDLCGIKLKLNHWLALNQDERQTLVDWLDTQDALEQLGEHLLSRTEAMADGQAKTLPIASGEPWQNPQQIPEVLIEAAQLRGIPLQTEQWGALNELERFALCKLARPGHDHHNLEAAFSEVLG